MELDESLERKFDEAEKELGQVSLQGQVSTVIIYMVIMAVESYTTHFVQQSISDGGYRVNMAHRR